MYVCVLILRVCLCACVCVYIYIHIHTYMQTCACIYIYIYYVCMMCIYTYLCMYMARVLNTCAIRHVHTLTHTFVPHTTSHHTESRRPLRCAAAAHDHCTELRHAHSRPRRLSLTHHAGWRTLPTHSSSYKRNRPCRWHATETRGEGGEW
jgi:hypothetical protein